MENKKIKLGIIISMFPELHETFIVRELAALEREGVDFEIFSLQKTRDPVTIEDAVRLMENRTHYAPLLGLKQLLSLLTNTVKHPLNMASAVLELIRYGWKTPKELLKSFAILPVTFYFSDRMQDKGIHHIHGHWANIPTTACWILSKVKGFTWSAAIHGEDIFSKNPLLEKKLEESKFTVVCTGFFCNHLKHKMNHTHPDDIHLNYHGLDPKVLERIATSPQKTFTPSEKGNSKGKKTILTIGRLVATKGHDDLIRATRLIKDKTKEADVHLNIIGSGPEEEALKKLVSELNLDDSVHFLGMMSFTEVMDEIQSADVFALACRMIPGTPPDGIPNVLAEAMAFGIPVVSTRVSAIPELIDDGVNGLLVDSSQHKQLAKAIELALFDAELSQNLSENAQKKVGTMFDQKENIKELIDLFETYVGPTRPN